MNVLKDKVTEKLSNLFADSPRKASSPRPSPSNTPEARPDSNAGNYFSSFFSNIIPTISFDGSKPENQHYELRAYQSLPVRWSSDEKLITYETGELEKKYIDDKKFSSVSNDKQMLTIEEDGGPASGRSSSDSDTFEEATEQHSRGKPLFDLSDDSVFISPDLSEFLQSCLPNIVKGCKWILMYSTLKHGISLRTLIHKSAELFGPCLLIAGDLEGAVFGAMLECPLKPTPKRKYQGTNQTFVFTTIHGEPRLFRPTGANRYYYMCLNDLLALGGGGNFALSLDGDLLSGTSGPCDTFGSSCLAHKSEFELKNVELWGFAHASRYLS
ncbi:TLD domain-containing protein 2 [Carica papaya]|uniref:TLD domain-containing protein 2 n=1 Tax=Carica papaya TaxID=3649 RepID=UPI000B8CA2D6|nr:TLD domain-containing protein 2 [Carica papaya]